MREYIEVVTGFLLPLLIPNQHKPNDVLRDSNHKTPIILCTQIYTGYPEMYHYLIGSNYLVTVCTINKPIQNLSRNAGKL